MSSALARRARAKLDAEVAEVEALRRQLAAAERARVAAERAAERAAASCRCRELQEEVDALMRDVEVARAGAADADARAARWREAFDHVLERTLGPPPQSSVSSGGQLPARTESERVLLPHGLTLAARVGAGSAGAAAAPLRPGGGGGAAAQARRVVGHGPRRGPVAQPRAVSHRQQGAPDAAGKMPEQRRGGHRGGAPRRGVANGPARVSPRAPVATSGAAASPSLSHTPSRMLRIPSSSAEISVARFGDDIGRGVSSPPSSPELAHGAGPADSDLARPGDASGTAEIPEFEPEVTVGSTLGVPVTSAPATRPYGFFHCAYSAPGMKRERRDLLRRLIGGAVSQHSGIDCVDVDAVADEIDRVASGSGADLSGPEGQVLQRFASVLLVDVNVGNAGDRSGASNALRQVLRALGREGSNDVRVDDVMALLEKRFVRGAEMLLPPSGTYGSPRRARDVGLNSAQRLGRLAGTGAEVDGAIHLLSVTLVSAHDIVRCESVVGGGTNAFAVLCVGSIEQKSRVRAAPVPAGVVCPIVSRPLRRCNGDR